MTPKDNIANISDPIVSYRLAIDCQTAGDYEMAIKYFKQAIMLDQDRIDAEIYAFAAWLLAMCPKSSLRDGSLAVNYATKACDLTDWSEGWTMGILAAAIAETGDINAAIKRQQQACEHAFKSDANMLEENLALLKAGFTIPFSCYP